MQSLWSHGPGSTVPPQAPYGFRRYDDDARRVAEAISAPGATGAEEGELGDRGDSFDEDPDMMSGGGGGGSSFSMPVGVRPRPVVDTGELYIHACSYDTPLPCTTLP